jgi:hypothetical protein
MRALEFLATRDGAMRIIFTPDDDIQIGINEKSEGMKLAEEEYRALFGEWIAVQDRLRKGIALR